MFCTNLLGQRCVHSFIAIKPVQGQTDEQRHIDTDGGTACKTLVFALGGDKNVVSCAVRLGNIDEKIGGRAGGGRVEDAI